MLWSVSEIQQQLRDFSNGGREQNYKLVQKVKKKKN